MNLEHYFQHVIAYPPKFAHKFFQLEEALTDEDRRVLIIAMANKELGDFLADLRESKRELKELSFSVHNLYSRLSIAMANRKMAKELLSFFNISLEDIQSVSFEVQPEPQPEPEPPTVEP